MAVGLNKSHKVTKNVSKLRHSGRHRHLTKHTKFVRDMIRRCAASRPTSGAPWSCSKCPRTSVRTLKFIKKRVGTHIRAKRKREELSNVLAAMRKFTQSANVNGYLVSHERKENYAGGQREVQGHEHPSGTCTGGYHSFSKYLLKPHILLHTEQRAVEARNHPYPTKPVPVAAATLTGVQLCPGLRVRKGHLIQHRGAARDATLITPLTSPSKTFLPHTKMARGNDTIPFQVREELMLLLQYDRGDDQGADDQDDEQRDCDSFPVSLRRVTPHQLLKQPQEERSQPGQAFGQDWLHLLGNLKDGIEVLQSSMRWEGQKAEALCLEVDDANDLLSTRLWHRPAAQDKGEEMRKWEKNEKQEKWEHQEKKPKKTIAKFLSSAMGRIGVDYEWTGPII
ncbi:hypothetical protein A6R68_22752, partial [Neotoma lepida]